MIKKANETDAYEIARLAVDMWDSHKVEELMHKFETIIKNVEAVVFMEYDQNTLIGFAQCQLRHDYVEGTHSSPVGYLEGIYVKEKFRNQGYAGKLLEACEEWAREFHCTEFASDCELGNDASHKFHLHAGFHEANRVISFTKRL